MGRTWTSESGARVAGGMAALCGSVSAMVTAVTVERDDNDRRRKKYKPECKKHRRTQRNAWSSSTCESRLQLI